MKLYCLHKQNTLLVYISRHLTSNWARTRFQNCSIVKAKTVKLLFASRHENISSPFLLLETIFLSALSLNSLSQDLEKLSLTTPFFSQKTGSYTLLQGVSLFQQNSKVKQLPCFLGLFRPNQGRIVDFHSLKLINHLLKQSSPCSGSYKHTQR